MRKITTLFAILVAIPAFAFAKTYTVSATLGRDTNPGTILKPFATISHAAALVQPGDTVLIRAGIYRETVRPVRSGVAGKPITFTASDKETVEIRGMDVAATVAPQSTGLLNYPWTEDKVYLSANNQSDFVFFRGKPVSPCRWPAAPASDPLRPGGAKIARVLSSDKTDKTAPGPGYPLYRVTFVDPMFNEPDNRWVGAKIWVGVCKANDTHDGDGQTGTVTATNQAAHTITCEIDASAKLGEETPGNFQMGRNCEYHLFDPATDEAIRVARTSGGAVQFWHDRKNERLVLNGVGGNKKNEEIEIKRRDWGFDLDNRSYITVKNIRLLACSITTDALAGNGKGNGGGRGSEPFLPKGVAPAHHIILDGIRANHVCHFTDQSGNLQTQWDTASGVILSGSDCMLKNSVIGHSAGCGLVVIGRRNKVINCVIHDTNYNVTDGGGIGLGVRPWTTTEDCEIAYCTIYNTGIDGIEFGALKNSDPTQEGVARIHHNVVHDTVLRSADSGGLHTFASDGQWTRIDHNIVYNTGGMTSGYLFFGIYLDYAPNDGNTPARYIVDHNVVYETASSLNLNHAHTNRIFNNTLVSSTEIARSQISSNGGEWVHVVLANNLGNTMYRGVGPGAKLVGNIQDARPPDVFIDATNPNRARRDYRPKKALPVGTSFAPFDDSTPPTVGAYEFGKPTWRAGANVAL